MFVRANRVGSVVMAKQLAVLTMQSAIQSIHRNSNRVDWRTLRSLLQNSDTRRLLLAYRDHERGRNILHLMCRSAMESTGDEGGGSAATGTGPLELLRQMHGLSPRMVLEEDQLGWTPLHYACQSASDEVVSFLLEVAPSTAGLATSEGDLPIGLAMRGVRAHGSSRIGWLLRLQPRAPSVPNRHGKTALDHLFFFKRYLHRTWERHGHDFATIANGNADYLAVRNLAEAFVLLLRHLHDSEGRRRGRPFRPLHLALSIDTSHDTTNTTTPMPVTRSQKHSFTHGHKNDYGDADDDNRFIHARVPSIFILLLCDIYPHHLRVADPRTGEYPLHLALAHRHFRRDTRLLRCMLRHYAGCADRPNASGVLPLSLAIEAGHEWNKGVLEVLLEEYPEALVRPDCDHEKMDNGIGSLPVVNKEGTGRQRSHHDKSKTQSGNGGLVPFLRAAGCPDASLDVIYRLLRMDPSVLRRSIMVESK